MEHSERILQIMLEREATPYKVSQDTGIAQSVFSAWKLKPTSKIYSATLWRLADYFDCSVDYLLGRTDNPEVNK